MGIILKVNISAFIFLWECFPLHWCLGTHCIPPCFQALLIDPEVTVRSMFLADTLKFMASHRYITIERKKFLKVFGRQFQFNKAVFWVLDDINECQICLVRVLPVFISPVLLIYESWNCVPGVKPWWLSSVIPFLFFYTDHFWLLCMSYTFVKTSLHYDWSCSTPDLKIQTVRSEKYGYVVQSFGILPYTHQDVWCFRRGFCLKVILYHLKTHNFISDNSLQHINIFIEIILVVVTNVINSVLLTAV